MRRLVGWLVLAACTTAASAETPVLNPLQGLDKDALKAFRDRPLFTPSRAAPPAAPLAQTAPPQVAAPPPAPEQPPTVKLVGIVTGDPDMALVRLGDETTTTFLTSGDKIGAWRITVLPAGIRLEADERRVDIDLFAAKTAPPASSVGAVDPGGPPPKPAEGPPTPP